MSVGGIILFPKDLIRMYNDEDAHSALFKRTDAGLVPRFPGTIHYLEEIFKGAKVTLQPKSMDSAIIIRPATIKDIWYECQDAGGQIVMACKILGAPSEADDVNPLQIIAQKCTIAILNGSLAEKDDNQGELPLEGAEPGDGDADGDPEQTAAEREEADATAAATGGDGESSIARQIRNAETKKKRAGRKGKKRGGA